MDIQSIKQRFGIIGNYSGLNRAIDIARQVAPTDLSVLIIGNSGTGKEIFPQIIHQFSSRKHGQYIAVNCGAIPEGTIDSELFGHEKGSFTGALDSRKGYFEVASGGTIFLDEIAELPLSTQVRLLRVLETGEFIRVGSSKVQKTDVRMVAATNIDITNAIQQGNFREDLYYRLNTIPIYIPPLKERIDDIYLLFKKFAQDFAERYKMPPISLNEEAIKILNTYDWPGNIRQLKNITEQISIIEKIRIIDAGLLKQYIPDYQDVKLPALFKNKDNSTSFSTEREILYKILFDMKNDVTDLKKLVLRFIQTGTNPTEMGPEGQSVFNRLFHGANMEVDLQTPTPSKTFDIKKQNENNIQDTEEIKEESLSIRDKEIELIKKSLEKHNGKRKLAADELGISERTLYRKIKEYDLE
jgi:transcriptional regulator with PAS, ATPase and Fis domain